MRSALAEEGGAAKVAPPSVLLARTHEAIIERVAAHALSHLALMSDLA